MRVKTAKDMGNLVHDRRKALGLTQAELAARVGVSRLWVNQVESGHGGAALAKVLHLLSALGLLLSLTTDDIPVVAPRRASAQAPAADHREAAATGTAVVRRTATATDKSSTKMAMPKPRRVTANGG